jgi:hypothetical protein
MGAFGNYNCDTKTAIDFSNMNTVTVMTNFNTIGKFVPVLFRIINPDTSEETVKVDSIKYTKELSNRISFCCLCSNGNRQHEVILTFYIMECVWIIEK